MHDYHSDWEDLDNWVFQQMNNKNRNKVAKNVFAEVYNKMKAMERSNNGYTHRENTSV